MADTIVLNSTGAERYDDAVADAAITPGDLVNITATGIIRHATAGGNAGKRFAVNSPDLNKGIDTDYAIADIARYVYAQSGTEIHALLPASAAAIVKGDFLESATAGKLRKHVAQSVNEAGAATVTIVANQIVAQALEAVDNSGGGTVVRIKVVVV